jgi:hypothetical protein
MTNVTARVHAGCLSGSLLPHCRFIAPPIGVHCYQLCGFARRSVGASNRMTRLNYPIMQQSSRVARFDTRFLLWYLKLLIVTKG